MTEHSPPRFTVRKGTEAGTWMVWDRQTQYPAKLHNGFATRLSEQWARELQKWLAANQSRTREQPSRGRSAILQARH